MTILDVLWFLGLLIGAASLAVIAGCAFMLFRNAWVYRQRVALLRDDSARYLRLASYDEMMRRWWVWDVDRFLGPGRRGRA